MVAQGCREGHRLSAWEQFKKLTPDRQLAKLQKERLCFYVLLQA
jgi:hypothetical protein